MNKRSYLLAMSFGLMAVFTGVSNTALAVSYPSTTPTKVWGQTDFTTNTAGYGSQNLFYPTSPVVDAHGNLYVVDEYNCRVLMYPSTASATGPTPTKVWGQPDFTTTTCSGSTTSSNFGDPYGVAVDSSGNVYVVDRARNRILMFPVTADANPNTNGGTPPAATKVWGQGSFTQGGSASVSAHSLRNPEKIALDSSGNLYVSDTGYSRTIMYPVSADADPISNGGTAPDATKVWGQANLTSRGSHPASSTSQNYPSGVYVSSTGDVYVADSSANRIVMYPAGGASAGASATKVWGQPDLNTGSSGSTATSLNYPYGNPSFDSRGNLYVPDTYNNRVLMYAVPSTPSTPSVPVAAAISSLEIGNATLSPSFTSNVKQYSARTSSGYITVKATLSTATSTIKLNGIPLRSGVKTPPIIVPRAGTALNLVVTSQDGRTTATYTVNVFALQR